MSPTVIPEAISPIHWKKKTFQRDEDQMYLKDTDANQQVRPIKSMLNKRPHMEIKAINWEKRFLASH